MSEIDLLKQNPYFRDISCKELNWILKKLSDQGGDLGALRAGQGYVSKERMSLERFDDGNDSIVAANPEVVALGDIVGQDNS
jgi:hypothetical protein